MEFTREDFLPAKKTNGTQVLSRPSLSYWQDAWIRLKANKSAMVSLAAIIFLVLFTLTGPYIWRIDPADQDLAQTSVVPSINTTAIVLDTLPTWEMPKDNSVPEVPTESVKDLPAPKEIKLMVPPTTKGVRIQWAGVAGAQGYAIFRNEVPPSEGRLGIPVGETSAGNQVGYEDALSLEVRTYYYSVVAVNMSKEESPNAQTIKIDVSRAIDLEKAQKLSPSAKVGDSVKLRPAPLGTDELGRDLLARLMFGGRVSLFIGFFASLCFVALGIFIGGISGYLGGNLDIWLMRFTDFVSALPFLLFVILLKVVLSVGPGESGIGALMIALVALSWTSTARLVRGQVLQIRESEYVQAAKLLGARPIYLLLRHLIPNLLGVILVTFTTGIPNAIFSEAFLSFIGLGVASPETSWGAMCTENIGQLFNHPHSFFLPAFFISLAVLAFNLFGDGLRDALDPRLRSVE